MLRNGKYHLISSCWWPGGVEKTCVEREEWKWGQAACRSVSHLYMSEGSVLSAGGDFESLCKTTVSALSLCLLKPLSTVELELGLVDIFLDSGLPKIRGKLFHSLFYIVYISLTGWAKCPLSEQCSGGLVLSSCFCQPQTHHILTSTSPPSHSAQLPFQFMPL